MSTTTVVEILDIGLNVITPLKSLMPFNSSGTVLQYSKELSDFGTCRIRISAYDSVLTEYGDIFVPHKYHVRIRRGTYIVWQGAITDNLKRNKSYIEIQASEYEYYLGKKLVHRTTPDVNGTPNIYRTFSSGTMAAAVTAIMQETIADYQGSNHVLANMTLGEIDNPNYPPGMTSDFTNGSNTGLPLTGQWYFGDGLTQATDGPELQFDFHNILYILKSFGIYSYADFQITNALVFNFRSFLGNNLLSSLSFNYGPQGNIEDYNLPRLGKRQTNSLIGIATDPNGVILNWPVSDQASIDTYGLMEDVAAYSDVKAQSTLDARTNAELPLISTADETNAIVYLNENGYPLGQYDIGDIVTIKVVNKGVNFNEIRRIVGITVQLNETGREMIALQSNIPLAWQYPNQ